MRLRLLMGPVAAVGLLLAPAALLADSHEPQEETTDMPATKHQEQVIKGKTESETPTRGQGDIVEGMPATEHQEEVLEEVAPAAGSDADEAQQNQKSTY